MTIEGFSGLARRDIHHVAFDVADVSDAIRFFGAAFGMGPFYRLLNPHGDDPNHVGAGFGSWGGIFVELIATPSAVPPGAPRLNHVAYMSTEPEKESARLSELGLPKTREFRVGDVWPQFHDASHEMGCAIEIHQACRDLDEFFRMVAESSVGWDGSDPERTTPAQGTR
jgi:catechol 2,3-dioxygenase-like lactoylglutathione lyase family enzyme